MQRQYRYDPDDPDRLLTPAEVEARYGISLTAQSTLRHRRQIPFYRAGDRSPRYRLRELEEWLAARRVPMDLGDGGSR